jgi:hypothetical protein
LKNNHALYLKTTGLSIGGAYFMTFFSFFFSMSSMPW